MWSPKQKDFFKNSTKSFNIMCGAVSSGKTYISNIRWFDYITNEAPDGCLLVMTGKTLESLHDNCIRDIKAMDEGINQFKFSHVREGAVTRIIYLPKGIEISCAGADNESSWKRIQGKTIAGWYADEITNHPKNLAKLLQKGCRHQGKQWPKFWTTNPDAPSHWVRKEYILNKEIDMNYWDFELDDNPSLTDDYKNELKATYSGMMYDRFILGKWISSAEYTVFTFDRSKNGVNKPLSGIDNIETWTAWDFGVNDPTAIIVFQVMQVPKAMNENGYLINIIDEYQNRNKDVKHYKKWCLSRDWWRRTQYLYHAGDPSGNARSHNLTSWIGELEPEIKIEYQTAYSIMDQVAVSNRFMSSVRICEQQCPITFEMFENWSYPTNNIDEAKEGAKPNHDQYSHPGTAWYYGMINRFPPEGSSGGVYSY